MKGVSARATRIAPFAVVLVLGALSSCRSDATSPSSRANGAEVGTPLFEAAEIGPGDWVVPTQEPDGIQIESTMSLMGKDTVLAIGEGSDIVRVSFGLVAPVVFAGTDVDLDGVSWVVSEGPQMWEASTTTASTPIHVMGAGAFDSLAEDRLRGLVVVPTEELPFPPLESKGPSMVAVVSVEFADQTYELRAREENGYLCLRIEPVDTAVCGDRIDEGSSGGALVAGPGLIDFQPEVGDTVVRVFNAGAVSDDVVRLDVELVDGSRMQTELSDPSEELSGLRFWLAVADLELAAPYADETPAIDPIVEWRAFDQGGRLIGTVTTE